MIELLTAIQTRLESLSLAANGVVYGQDLPSQYKEPFLGFNLLTIDYGDSKNDLESIYLIGIETIIPVGNNDLSELQENTIQELQQAFFKKPLLRNTYTYLHRAIIKVETKGIKALKISFEIKIKVIERY